MNVPRHCLLLLLPLALALTACATTFTRHTLDLPVDNADAEHLRSDLPAIRIALPHYVDTRPLLRRAPDGTLRRFEAHEWAELPTDGFARLLRERLGSGDTPIPGGLLRVEYTRFELDRDGIFRARGTWQLRDAQGQTRGGGLAIDRSLERVTPQQLVTVMSESVGYTADAILAAFATETPPAAAPPTDGSD